MLTHKQIWLLAWAVDHAASVKGGIPDKEGRDEHAMRIKDAKAALSQLRREKRGEEG